MASLFSKFLSSLGDITDTLGSVTQGVDLGQDVVKLDQGYFNPYTDKYYDTKEAAIQDEVTFRTSPLGKLSDQIIGTSDFSKSTTQLETPQRELANTLAQQFLDQGVTDLSQISSQGNKLINTVTNTELNTKLGNPDALVNRTNILFGTDSSGKPTIATQYIPPPPDNSSFFGGLLRDVAPVAGLGLMFVPGLQGLGATIGTSLGASGVAASALGNAIIGGTLAEASGGDFAKGALSGGIGGLAAPVSGGLSSALGGGQLGTALGTGLTSAGIASLQGGDATKAFLQGAAGGASGYNPADATDVQFLAADAAQMAASGLSESAIIQNLSSYTSAPAAALAASMAVNKVPETIAIQQLTNLSSNTGLTNTPISDAELAAADALQLYKQVGFNAPAIEQNLVSSGLDPLIAADITQQIGLNPNISLNDLSYSLADYYGNDLYGKTIGQINASNTSSATRTEPASSTDWGKLAQGLVGLLGGGLLANTGNAPSATSVPAYQPLNTMPEYSPEYFKQVQQYYTGYMPNMPRDVATPLQQWYSQGDTGPDEYTKKAFGG